MVVFDVKPIADPCRLDALSTYARRAAATPHVSDAGRRCAKQERERGFDRYETYQRFAGDFAATARR